MRRLVDLVWVVCATTLRGRALSLSSTTTLGGRRHRLTLDFGREENTWMPPRWAASGERTVFSLEIDWKADGSARVEDCRPLRGLALGTGTKWEVSGARWAVDGRTLRVEMRHGGFEVGDCAMDAGDLSLAIPVFSTPTGPVLSSKEGIMSIIAYRFYVRKERRMVGVWFAEEILPPTEKNA